MMNPEKKFYELFKTKLGGKSTHIQRIESSVTQGIPDVNYCINGVEGWLELKSWEKAIGRGDFYVPKLRPQQCAWLHRRSSAGGRALLLCRVSGSILAFDGLVAPVLLDVISWEAARNVASLWLLKDDEPYWPRVRELLTKTQPKKNDILEKIESIRPIRKG